MSEKKLEFYKTVAREFSQIVPDFESVKEVAIFTLVAANDPYPTDVDMALALPRVS